MSRTPIPDPDNITVTVSRSWLDAVEAIARSMDQALVVGRWLVCPWCGRRHRRDDHQSTCQLADLLAYLTEETETP